MKICPKMLAELIFGVMLHGGSFVCASDSNTQELQLQRSAALSHYLVSTQPLAAKALAPQLFEQLGESSTTDDDQSVGHRGAQQVLAERPANCNDPADAIPPASRTQRTSAEEWTPICCSVHCNRQKPKQDPCGDSLCCSGMRDCLFCPCLTLDCCVFDRCCGKGEKCEIDIVVCQNISSRSMAMAITSCIRRIWCSSGYAE